MELDLKLIAFIILSCAVVALDIYLAIKEIKKAKLEKIKHNTEESSEEK